MVIPEGWVFLMSEVPLYTVVVARYFMLSVTYMCEECWASGFGFRVPGSKFRVSGFGCRAWFGGLMLWVQGSVFKISGFRFQVSGVGFMFPGSGLRASGQAPFKALREKRLLGLGRGF
jgi:hypothetical protein